MKTSHLTAVAIALALVAWLLTGELGDSDDGRVAPSIAEERDAERALEQDTPTRVRARVIRAQRQSSEVVVRGQTESNRTVTLRAETGGRIAALPRDRGARVRAGDVVCRLAVEDREARVEEAREAVAEARINYEGARKLAERGLQSEAAIASARARLAAARATLEAREVDLARTRITAPFEGVVEERPVELGDYLQPGGVCATIIDRDPILLVGRVSEKEIARVERGDDAHGELITGERVSGRVAFSAQTASEETRTYRVEIDVPNPDGRLRSGLTAEIRMPVESYMAHRVPPSLLALDDAGALGLRIVDASGVVRFRRVKIVKEEAAGVWVTGLPEVATVITVGQEMVVAGQPVEVTYEPSAEMPASAPEGRGEQPSAEDDQGKREAAAQVAAGTRAAVTG